MHREEYARLISIPDNYQLKTLIESLNRLTSNTMLSNSNSSMIIMQYLSRQMNATSLGQQTVANFLTECMTILANTRRHTLSPSH